jgi:autotransporter-associated beta strand protein
MRSSSMLTSGRMTAGSIEGAGTYRLGSKALTIGLNNLSTVVSGTITDGGFGGGTGGSLIKVGTGTLTLSGANTYTGGTTISAGTLQLGAGGATGSIKGNVINNSVFAINRSDTFTFGGNISGTGSFQQLGSGMTILTAADSYSGGTTISAGVLNGAPITTWVPLREELLSMVVRSNSDRQPRQHANDHSQWRRKEPSTQMASTPVSPRESPGLAN